MSEQFLDIFPLSIAKSKISISVEEKKDFIQSKVIYVRRIHLVIIEKYLRSLKMIIYYLKTQALIVSICQAIIIQDIALPKY